jgi:hypothetical protein
MLMKNFYDVSVLLYEVNIEPKHCGFCFYNDFVTSGMYVLITKKKIVINVFVLVKIVVNFL